MTISMYQASVPMMIRMLTNLKGILAKAAAHARDKKIEEAVLLGARLYPDMFPLTRQVQVASDFARRTAARLAGREPLALEDNEKTFDELIARLDRSIEYARSIPAGEIDGSEAREIVFPVRGQPKRLTGMSYLCDFALPNFFFHVTTAYAILRHNGVEIGKADYIGALD
ncbi:MAG TPA: DUF1993 domain-containing protein [Casimicrobiaceae bacterium]|nr:DUF1993 domain-containing protein [Casimicrobiaceae bacterium]